MDPLGVNKWAAAIIAGLLLIMIISSVSETMFHEDDHAAVAYGIEVASAEGAVAVVEEAGPTLAELLMTADVAKGARVFAKCKSCHSVDAGGKNGTGPNLYGTLGRGIAGVDGFKYSAALAGNGGTWGYDELDAWLASPKNFAPGTSMSFAGLRKPVDRANLIAFLRANADAEFALPTVDAVVEAVVEEVADAAH